MINFPDNKTRTLEEWRAVMGYSKSSVARHLGVHPSTYSRIEDHPESMSIDTAMSLTELFKCNVRQIIFLRKILI